MKTLLIILLVFATVHQVWAQTKPAGHKRLKCGSERWSTKTGQDKEWNLVQQQPVWTTIEELRTLAPPPDLKQTPSVRHPPAEITTYTVTAYLIGYKREADRDYHLILASPEAMNITMIAEIPSGLCVGDNLRSVVTKEQKWVRDHFGAVKQPGRLKSFSRSPKLVTVTGVGFFDFSHGQDGVAPNAIELHPVLKIDLYKPTVVH